MAQTGDVVREGCSIALRLACADGSSGVRAFGPAFQFAVCGVHQTAQGGLGFRSLTQLSLGQRLEIRLDLPV